MIIVISILFFANLNGIKPLSGHTSLVFGSQITSAFPRGFIYDERYYDDNRTVTIDYSDYRSGAYELDFRASAGLWKRDTVSSRQTSRLLILNYSFNRRRNFPNSIPIDRALFDYYDEDLEPLVRYRSDNDYSHDLNIMGTIGDLYPDRVTIDLPLHWGILNAQMEFEKFSMELGYSYVRNQISLINQWERESGVYRGETFRRDVHNEIYLNSDHAIKMFFFKAVFLRMYYRSMKEFELYHKTNSFNADLKAGLGIGIRFISREKYFLEGGLDGFSFNALANFVWNETNGINQKWIYDMNLWLSGESGNRVLLEICTAEVSCN